jgi:hypothetical protein
MTNIVSIVTVKCQQGSKAKAEDYSYGHGAPPLDGVTSMKKCISQ